MSFYNGGAARGGVDWSYYNNEWFDRIDDMYLPARGEGDTMASQIVTAVNKLVYKWYNDGDVYDNTHHMEGWWNDLSDYANWLWAYTDAGKILERIKDCYSDAEYEYILQDLADTLLTDENMAEYAKREKVGSIYDCEGPFKFKDNDEQEED